MGQVLAMGEKLQRRLYEKSGGRLDAVSNAICQWMTVPRSSAIFASRFSPPVNYGCLEAPLVRSFPIVNFGWIFYTTEAVHVLSSKIKHKHQSEKRTTYNVAFGRGASAHSCFRSRV